MGDGDDWVRRAARVDASGVWIGRGHGDGTWQRGEISQVPGLFTSTWRGDRKNGLTTPNS